ncbi:MAG TPA: DUF423 domain-containing protein [Bryobacteraceae bacterium]|jgi:uncharacterized membrane protein YgdD (TMEM256/DUF423 family)
MNWSATAATALALAVIFGAFGAHGLRDKLDAYSTSVYEKAVLYHFFHALGLLFVSLMPKLGYLSTRQAGWVCALLLAGVVLFSGSLYVLAVTRIQMLGIITPFGGLAFIAGWLALAWMLLRNQG